MRIVEVGSGEVEAPSSVSVVKEMTEVSATMVLLLTRTQLDHSEEQPRHQQERSVGDGINIGIDTVFEVSLQDQRLYVESRAKQGFYRA